MVISVVLAATGQAAATEQREHLHLTVNLDGDYTGAAAAGFNLADVSSQSALNALPEGMKGVYWLGNGYNLKCSWRLSDKQISDAVRAIKDNPKFSGIYYISDEPHPAVCPDAPQRLAERSALIRSLDSRAKTFAVVLNGSSAPTEFAQMKDSADYIGIDPYPCNFRNELTGCNYAALRERIDQALAAGIPSTSIVPVFQTFGQGCSEGDKQYWLPTVEQLHAILARWDQLTPRPPLEVSYSWGRQEEWACPSLADASGGAHPDLQSVMKARNTKR